MKCLKCLAFSHFLYANAGLSNAGKFIDFSSLPMKGPRLGNRFSDLVVTRQGAHRGLYTLPNPSEVYYKIKLRFFVFVQVLLFYSKDINVSIEQTSTICTTVRTTTTYLPHLSMCHQWYFNLYHSSGSYSMRILRSWILRENQQRLMCGVTNKIQ